MAKCESRQALVAEVVEEPLSATLVPLALKDGKVLLGTALRTKRVALMDVKIYALAVYGEPEDFSEWGSLNGNASTDELMASLLQSQAEKVFGLTFLRSVTRKQVQDGLAEGLCDIAGVPRADVEGLTQHLPSSVDRGTELQLLVRPLQGGVGFDFGSGMEFLGGKETLCHGIHEIFFGRRSVVQGLGEAIQRQRLLLAARGILGGALPAEQHHIEDDGNDTVSFAALTPRCHASSESARNNEGLEVTSIDSEGGLQSFTGSFSWKQSSGRSRGKDGYKFGDLTRTIIKKTKKNRGNSENIPDQDDMWPAALFCEGERAVWVMFGDKDRLDATALAAQSLKGTFNKYHGSAVRGRLVPQWSVRHYELNAGLLQYRRRAAGKICGVDSLDGARVVTEIPKLSRAGAHFVFRVIKGDEAICRLSCPHQQQAVEWVVALAGACTHFRAMRNPGEQLQLQVVAQSMDDGQEEEEQRHFDVEGTEDTTPVAQPVQDALTAQQAEVKQAPDLRVAPKARKPETSVMSSASLPDTAAALSSGGQSRVASFVKSVLQQLDPYVQPLQQFYLRQLKLYLQPFRHYVEQFAPSGQWLRAAIVAVFLVLVGRRFVALQ